MQSQNMLRMQWLNTCLENSNFNKCIELRAKMYNC